MKTPEAITKRDILHGVKKRSQQEIQELAQHFNSKEWFSDGIDFSAQHPELLQEARQKAALEGDTFLFLKASRLIDETEIPQELLSSCAKNAEEKGKIRYAIMAFEKLGQTEKVDALRETIKNDGDIVTEQEEDVFIPEHIDEIDK